MPTPPSPHDRLFSELFSNPEIALEELRALLPPELFAALDPDSLTLLRSRSTTTDLPDVVSDIVYAARLADASAALWFQFEHQSLSQRRIPLRLLRYMVAGWTRALRAKKRGERDEIPLIIPIVVLHDPKGRRPPLRFSELYAASDELLARVYPFCPDFTYLCDDLMAVTEEDIEARSASAAYRLTLWLLRSRGQGEPPRFEAYKAAFEALAAQEQWHYARAFLRYTVDAGADPEPTPLLAARAANPIFEDDTVALKDIWFEEGLQKGIEQGLEQGLEKGIEKGIEKGRVTGRAEGRAGLLLEQLRARFGGRPEDIAARVHHASEADLHQWALRILRAESLAEVFEDA